MKMKQEKTISLSYFLFCLLTTFTVSAIPHSNNNQTDKIALLDFKHRISKDPYGVFLNSWNESLHHCGWEGVSCGRRHQRVVALRLPEKGLVGTISPQIGNLTFLREIDLSKNMLFGRIPGEIGRLFRLRYLNLSTNAFIGELVAVNLTNCLRIRTIDVSKNGLRGGIPPAFGNLSMLQELILLQNHLEGSIPNEITQCRGLNVLSLGTNNLTGTLSFDFFNMTFLRAFSITNNLLEGTIPSNIGETMPNLEVFYFGGNRFHGTIPISFPNASKLQYLEISQNNFVGKVPKNIGKLKDLVLLDLSDHHLGGDLTFIPSLSNCSNLKLFSISVNKFESKLPNSISNLSSQLSSLYLDANKFSGKIPIGIKNLANLILLNLGENFLSGVIPSEIGGMQKLQVLALHQNKLSGEIPPNLYNLTSLSSLFMYDNNLEGNIVSSVGNFVNLIELVLRENNLNGTIPQQVFELPSLTKYLDLSSNSFSGPLTPAVGKLKTLNWLDISRNKISGKIPDSIGDCLSLEYLDIHANRLEGKIPPSLSFLRSIGHLDISNNKLTGEIPRELQNLHFLQYLNLSFNDLEGEVPKIGVFAAKTNASLIGNKNLCGGVPELKLPSCPVKIRKHKKHLKLIIFTCASVGIVLVIVLVTVYWKKDKRKDSTDIFKVGKLFKIAYSTLHQATDGFSETNLIGSGSFGSVYKGKFEQGDGEQIVAVKVLDLLKNGASKSFVAECKVLRNIRHRNLVPILTCCSSCDYAGNEFKALVYEFMESGDLDMWLHSPHARTNNVLSVVQRLNIAIDVASALHYLHGDCEPMVIHCDLKPSNILLDKDLTAHVGDFGLSRLYSRTIENSFGEQTSTVGLKGSIGYVPPEYGLGANASTSGDVYSFGILLLEMFTAKRPTDDLFSDKCSSLNEYVEVALAENVMKIVDPLLLPCLESSSHGINHDNLMEMEESKIHNFFQSIFKIGLNCAARLPMDRPHMNDVTRELHKIKKAFFT